MIRLLIALVALVVFLALIAQQLNKVDEVIEEGFDDVDSE